MASTRVVNWEIDPESLKVNVTTTFRTMDSYIVGRSLLPRNFRFLTSALLRPVILCGEHPLATYCTGGLLATMGTLLIAKHGSDYGWTITINIAGWTACLLVAWAAAEFRRRRR